MLVRFPSYVVRVRVHVRNVYSPPRLLLESCDCLPEDPLLSIDGSLALWPGSSQC